MVLKEERAIKCLCANEDATMKGPNKEKTTKKSKKAGATDRLEEKGATYLLRKSIRLYTNLLDERYQRSQASYRLRLQEHAQTPFSS